MPTWLTRILKIFGKSNGNGNGNGVKETEPSKYKRGDFKTKSKDKVEKLIKQDRQARVIYEGVETQIDQLRQINLRIQELNSSGGGEDV